MGGKFDRERDAAVAERQAGRDAERANIMGQIRKNTDAAHRKVVEGLSYAPVVGSVASAVLAYDDYKSGKHVSITVTVTETNRFS